jgi:hypothetical protein
MSCCMGMVARISSLTSRTEFVSTSCWRKELRIRCSHPGTVFDEQPRPFARAGGRNSSFPVSPKCEFSFYPLRKRQRALDRTSVSSTIQGYCDRCGDHLLELIRHIHLSPVRAGIVADPAGYRCSSHRAYQGKEVLPWLSADWILSRYPQREQWARRQYRNFIATGIGGGYGKESHSGTREGRILGDGHFADDALRRSGEKMKRPIPLDEIIIHVCKRYKLKPADLSAPGKTRKNSEVRAIIGLLVWYEDHLSLTELGTRLGRDVSSLSQAVNRLHKRAEADRRLAAELKKLKEGLA